MILRVVNGFLLVLLAAFAAVQYNDPDVYFWFPVYAGGAAWCALAAFRPALLGIAAVRALLAASVLVAIAGTVHFWPAETHFWWREVWWDSEPAREGMGMMILTACLAGPLIAAARGNARH